jgi:hypothetical protein
VTRRKAWQKSTAHARRRSDGRLGALPHVRATAFGLARRDGELLDEPAYLVFVDRKLPKSRLRSESRVPRFVTRGGQRLYTDVLEIGRPMLQSAIALNDRKQQSTTTCFARKANGVYAVSCAHGLVGPDGYAITPDPIEVWRASLSRWETLGESDLTVQSAGTGVPPHDFGWSCPVKWWKLNRVCS